MINEINALKKQGEHYQEKLTSIHDLCLNHECEGNAES